ncbi:MAG: RNA methyltransferase [Clostridia bacterium]
MEVVASITNSKVAFVKKLKDKNFRIEEGMFVVEGENIVKDLPTNYEVYQVFVLAKLRSKFQYILDRYDDNIVVEVIDKVMDAMSETVTPSGILAVVKIPTAQQILSGNIIVLDGINDPGNMGTIARTAVACGVKNIIAINCVDWTNGKVVRSSMGAIFRVNFVVCDTEKALQLIDNRKVLCLDMAGQNIFEYANNHEPFALVVGSEAQGVGQQLRNACNVTLSLPMVGDIESLNASVSLSVALYNLSFSK